MRLAQLARKFGITQNEIVSILKSRGFEVAENGNSKLTLEEVEILKEHVGFEDQPTEEESTKNEDNLTSDSIAEQPEPIEVTELKEATPEPQVDSSEEEKEQAVESTPIEVIRAKKVKLEGIKVVGKIELPEPPALKEAVVKEEEKVNSSGKQKAKKQESKKRKRPSYEEKLKRQEERAAQERKKRIKKIKEKKKNHYYHQVQPKVIASNKKKVKKTKPVKSGIQKKPLPQHKNPIRKFWAWINGEYDRG